MPTERDHLARALADLPVFVRRAVWHLADPADPTRSMTYRCALSADELLARPSTVARFHDTLRVLEHAGKYHPCPPFVVPGVPMHNELVSEQLRGSYTASAFEQLFNLCRTRGVFELSFDKVTGLSHTTAALENPDMGTRYWVTDIVRCLDVAWETHPDAACQALGTLARFYTSEVEQAAFRDARAHYRASDPARGVAHLFLVDPFTHELARDPTWSNHKRLESHGLALGAFVAALAKGLLAPTPAIVHSVRSLVAYFRDIDYPSAPSAGCWEELVFEGGMTWDTEAIRAGLEAVHRVVTSPDPALASARAALVDMAVPGAPALPEAGELLELIDAGARRVRHFRAAESPGQRELDAALTFLSSSSIVMSELEDPIARAHEDLARHTGVLELVGEKLVRSNGMIRYAPFELEIAGKTYPTRDAYLTLNYWLLADEDGCVNAHRGALLAGFGSKDATDPRVFLGRSLFAPPDREAEWFMVSDAARGWGRQIAKLLDLVEHRGTPTTPAEAEWLRGALQKQAEHINRAYARITGPAEPGALLGTKANGRECPRWKVPEAFEWVTTLSPHAPAGPKDHQRAEATMLPGAHTPLAWAAASLFAASRQVLENLRRLERIAHH